MDLDQFFDKNELKKADMAIAKINGMVGKTVTVNLLPPPSNSTTNVHLEEELLSPQDGLLFPLYAGEITSEARLAIDRCIASSNPNRINNSNLLGQALKKFTVNHQGKEVWLDLPELKDSSVIGTYKIQLISLTPSSSPGIADICLKFLDQPKSPKIQWQLYVKWLKLNGYFFAGGMLEMTDDVLDSFEIWSINYFDVNTNRCQDFIPYVPF
jgi:hypothetical protein